MAHYNRWLTGLLGVAMLAACSDDVVKPDSSTKPIRDDEGEGVYMSVNIKMPTGGGTRSYTDSINSSNSGTEIGKDYENNVNTVYLVLAETENNEFITWGEIPASGIVKSTDGTQYTSTAKFSKSELAVHYQQHHVDSGKNRDVNVFVFCNPTLTLRNLLDGLSVGDKWADEATGKFNAADVNAEVIWSENNFLMSNSEIAVRTIPRTIDEWDVYSDESKAFNLSGTNGANASYDNSANGTYPRGPVKVERTAARLDFRDGSPNGGNLYHVVYSDEEINGEKPCYIDIKLHKMSLTNMNKEFYFLRRVSDNGLEAKATLCGNELPWFTNSDGTLNQTLKGNYVVNPLASKMENPILNDFSQYFNYPFFNNEGEIDNVTLSNWFTSVIDDVIKGPKDDYTTSEGVTPALDKSYHIWRYVTENTIPGIDMQKNGQSTGVIFKGQIVATAEALNAVGKDGKPDENIRELARIINNLPETENGPKPLTGDPSKDPIIYKFKGTKNNVGGMYATWPNVEQAAKVEAITPVWEADNTPAGGFWRLEINRSAPLFHAVFGNGSCGEYSFTTTTSAGADTTITVKDPITTVNDSTPSYAWHKWNEEGRPVPQSADQAKDPKFASYYQFKAAAVAADFTLYQTSFDGTNEYGYYCYYYYWNRHNDNGRSGVMGPMEFAAVRNNVYKLAVTSISNIGHPRLTENDPDKPTPDTDDENDDIYIAVDVQVLPWVVRVNDIVF